MAYTGASSSGKQFDMASSWRWGMCGKAERIALSIDPAMLRTSFSRREQHVRRETRALA